MSQPTQRILTTSAIDNSDYRNQYVELVTDATDYATADSSLVLSTVPFLKVGDSFTNDDVPLFPVGICQQFSYNEGLGGNFIPEIGSSRKTGASGTASGSGMISRFAVHGNSLTAALYRPTLMWIASSEVLSGLIDRIAGTDKNWITALNVQDVDLFSSDVDSFITRVVASGGMNALLYKIPFGMVEVKRDARQRVIAINYLEQCLLLGDQSGLSAGQFQILDQMSFNYERKRPLKAIGPFALSEDEALGIPDRGPEES